MPLMCILGSCTCAYSILKFWSDSQISLVLTHGTLCAHTSDIFQSIDPVEKNL